MTIRFETVSGPGGKGHYINDYRCGGTKPLGGGTVVFSANLAAKDVVEALATHPEGIAALNAYVAAQAQGGANG